MKERIKDKIEEVEKYLSILKDIIPENIESYKNDEGKKWSCERGIERISEASVDLAFLLIKERKFENALDDINAFEVLKKHKIISSEICEKLQELKKMRNILIHLYGQVDDDKVFHAISEELENDIDKYLNFIKQALEGKENVN